MTTGGPAKAKAPPKPPPPPPPQAAATNGAAMFWYMPVAGGQPEQGTAHEIKTHLAANGLDATKVLICPEDSAEWVSAASCGITAEVPY
jgi:hypothetical protein